MSIESVMPSNHLILCRPLLLLPSIFPSIRVFSNESLGKTLMLRLKAGGERDDRGWDGWVASLTQWTWVWASSESWWWIRKPGMLQSMGSQRVGHDWAPELNWTAFPMIQLVILNWWYPNTKLKNFFFKEMFWGFSEKVYVADVIGTQKNIG